MRKSLMLLTASALTVVTLAAIPAAASAGEWKLDCPSGAATCNYTVSGGHAQLRIAEEATITCTSSAGFGSVSSGGTTGTMGLTLKGCTATLVFTFECHTSGAVSGEINMGSSAWHNIYLTDDKIEPGTLVTPVSTTISCGGFSGIVLTGNGVIGRVPQVCNSESSILNINFEANSLNPGTQRYEQITATGTVFDLHAVTHGSSTPHTAVLETSMAVAFTGGGKGKITCV